MVHDMPQLQNQKPTDTEVTRALQGVAQQIRTARAVLGAQQPGEWQQQAVAKRAGVSSHAVANAEKCPRQVRVLDLYRIAHVLGLAITIAPVEEKT